MWSGIVIVVEVIRKDAIPMSFVEHDQAIQAISAYAADYTLAIRILPGRVWCDQNFLDIHILDSISISSTI